MIGIGADNGRGDSTPVTHAVTSAGESISSAARRLFHPALILRLLSAVTSPYQPGNSQRRQRFIDRPARTRWEVVWPVGSAIHSMPLGVLMNGASEPMSSVWSATRPSACGQYRDGKARNHLTCSSVIN